MATIKFYLRSKNNPTPIYIRLIDGRKVDISTKTNFLINYNDWSEAKQRPKSLTNIHFKNLDTDLQNLRTNLLNHYNKSNENINLLWLKNFINPIVEKNEIPDKLVPYFDYYLKQRGSEIETKTKNKILVVKNKLIKFEQWAKSIIFLKDVNIDFKNKFEAYNIENGYAENTFHNNLKEIKAICRHARDKGLQISNEIDKFKIVQKKAESIYLTFNELDLIENIQDEKLTTENLKIACDWLIISCYTAQRVSDFMRFTSKMIREEVHDNKIVKLIEFTQQKGKKKIALPLHPKVLKILEARNNEFPKRLYDQDYNELIKVVGQIAGINTIVHSRKINPKTNRKEYGDYPKYELITSHIGRRSFATNFYGKIPTPLLMVATGHSTEKMFLIYVGKTPTESAVQLGKYF